jgi:hypothetical protein
MKKSVVTGLHITGGAAAVMTKIMACVCAHPYQDECYGKKQRVFNASRKDNKVLWRCSVCGKTINS